jgi:hypothetical protein
VAIDGQERVAGTLRLCQMNLAVHGLEQLEGAILARAFLGAPQPDLTKANMCAKMGLSGGGSAKTAPCNAGRPKWVTVPDRFAVYLPQRQLELELESRNGSRDPGTCVLHLKQSPKRDSVAWTSPGIAVSGETGEEACPRPPTSRCGSPPWF